MESSERYVIYQIEKTGINDLQEQLKKDFNTEIPYTATEFFEKDYYYNSWVDEKGEKDFQIIKKQIENEDNVKFLYAKGLFESGVGKDKAIHNDQLLPRNARVFNHETDVCFIEIDDILYAVLKINLSLESRIRSVLFNFKNNEGKKSKIKFRKINNYTLNSDFYYWMFYKSTNHKIKDELTFFNISSLSQKDSTKAYNTNSVGDEILNYTNVLSGLGERQEISKAQIGINYKGSQIVAEIQKFCSFEVDSKIVKENYDDNDFINTALFIYVDLLPTLLKKYSEDKTCGVWNEDNTTETIKEWALLAIANLCVVNDIEIEEIVEKLEDDSN